MDLIHSMISVFFSQGATATIRRKFDPTVPHKTESKKPEIAYPPSMVKIEREKRENAASRWLAVKTPQDPPRIQMIPNREPPQPSAPTISQVATNIDHRPVPDPNLRRGRGGVQHYGYERDGCIAPKSPTSICPVCQFEFPTGFSEISASNHVNGHFADH